MPRDFADPVASNRKRVRPTWQATCIKAYRMRPGKSHFFYQCSNEATLHIKYLQPYRPGPVHDKWGHYCIYPQPGFETLIESLSLGEAGGITRSVRR